MSNLTENCFSFQLQNLNDFRLEPVTHAAQDNRARRAGRSDGLKTEVFGASNPDLRPSTFGPHQSRPSHLSQASAIAIEVFMNNAGKRGLSLLELERNFGETTSTALQKLTAGTSKTCQVVDLVQRCCES